MTRLARLLTTMLALASMGTANAASACACFSMGGVSLGAAVPVYGMREVANDTTFVFSNDGSAKMKSFRAGGYGGQTMVSVLGQHATVYESMRGSFVCKCMNSYVERKMNYIMVANQSSVAKCLERSIMKAVCSSLRDMELVHACLTSWTDGFTGIVHECVMRSGLLADMVRHVARPLTGECVDGIAFVGAEDVVATMS